MPNVGRKKGKNKNLAGSNNRNAEHRYWTGRRLRENKVRSLMRHNGMTRSEAENFWDLARKEPIGNRLKKNPRK